MKQMMNAPPGNCTDQEKILWQKIHQFQLDDPYATLPFSRKLALKQHWDYDFTLAAIEEYRKFIFLCCISPHGASPSRIIDEVWHLHLIYTENYWEDFCAKTLQRKLHHQPSRGGLQQRELHLDWQQDTLQNYRHTFLQDPPAAYWIDTANAPKKTIHRFRKILQSALGFSLLVPLLLISGCDGGFVSGLAGFVVVMIITGIFSLAGSTHADPNKRKDHEGGSTTSSSGSCGSSCGGGSGGGGCGGGCGGCGGS